MHELKGEGFSWQSLGFIPLKPPKPCYFLLIPHCPSWPVCPAGPLFPSWSLC